MENYLIPRTAYTSAYARLMEQYEPEGKRLLEIPMLKIFLATTWVIS